MLVNEETGSGRRRGCWVKVVSVILTWKPLVDEAVSHCPTWPWLLIAWLFSLLMCISQGAYFWYVFVIAPVFEGSSIHLCFFHFSWIVSFTFHLPLEQGFVYCAAAPTYFVPKGWARVLREKRQGVGGALLPSWLHVAPGPLGGSFSIYRSYFSLQPFWLLSQN